MANHDVGRPLGADRSVPVAVADDADEAWPSTVLEAPASESSLADLVHPIPPLQSDVSGKTVHEMFSRMPNLFAVTILDAHGHPVGVVNRFRFFERLSKTHGAEAIASQPVEAFMDRSPLVVDEYTPLDVVADLLADDSTKYIFDGFIVTRGGTYLGMGTGFGLMRQLTERKQVTLQHLANHDVLTDLPNRQLFCDRFDQALARSRVSGRPTVVLHADVDRFRGVNDAFGQGTGDLLLLETAARLTDAVRIQDTVARLAGDEFGVILSEIDNVEDAERLADTLLTRAADPLVLDGHEVNVSCSIGMAVFPDDGHTGDALLRAANDALSQAKEVRNAWQRHSPEMRRATTHTFRFSYVKRGMENGFLTPYFQPIIDVRTGRIRSVEALARWHDPEHGLMPTLDLIRFAEDSGLIGELCDRIIVDAMRAVAGWQQRLAPDLGLAVNVSGVQFRGSGLVPQIRRSLDATGFPPELLELEITETTVMGLGSVTFTALGQLKAMGVSLSVDDFGTGYSSLSRLQRLPVDVLKVDRSFVQVIDKKSRRSAIASAIVMMAHSLGLSVTAEGVESQEQLAFLTAEGCDRVQGYLFSPPLPAPDLERNLQAQTWAPRTPLPVLSDRPRRRGAGDQAPWRLDQATDDL